MLGREGELEASSWSSVEPGSCFFRYVGGIVVENQLDRGAGRISGVEKLKEVDELSAAVAVSDERVDLAAKQVNSGQQAERAMTFVLVIPRKGRVDAGLGRQIRRRRCEGGSQAFRHRKRSPLACWLCATWRQLFSNLDKDTMCRTCRPTPPSRRSLPRSRSGGSGTGPPAAQGGTWARPLRR